MHDNPNNSIQQPNPALPAHANTNVTPADVQREAGGEGTTFRLPRSLTLFWMPILLVTCAVGYGWCVGTVCRFTTCLGLVSTASVAGIIALAAGAITRSRQGAGGAETILLVYCIFLILMQPPLHVRSFGVFKVMAFLIPVVVGLPLFPRRGAWASACGAALLLFAAIAALTFNLRHEGAGIGFWLGWLE